LRDRNSIRAGTWPVSRGQKLFCATNFHFAGRKSGLRRQTPILRGWASFLRGQNPLCATNNQFARVIFNLRGLKPGFLWILPVDVAQKVTATPFRLSQPFTQRDNPYQIRLKSRSDD